MAIQFKSGDINIRNAKKYINTELNFAANYRYHVVVEFDVTTDKYSVELVQTWPETRNELSYKAEDFDFRYNGNEIDFVDSIALVKASDANGMWMENFKVVEGEEISPEPSEPTEPSEPSNSLEIFETETDTEYKAGTNDSVTIHCAGNHNELDEVKVDGNVVDNSNYIVKEGSTIVEFKPAYLNSLTPGEHSVVLVYTGNRTTEPIKINIEAATNVPDEDESGEDEADEVVDTNVNNTENSGSSATITSTAAPTGDNSNLALWIMMIVISVTGLGLVLMKKKSR